MLADLLCLEEKWRLQGGYQGRGQAIVLSRLVKEFGSILEESGALEGFLFLLFCSFFLKFIVFTYTKHPF